MIPETTDTPLMADCPSAPCSPSFDPKVDNECTLQRHKDGRLEILSAPPIFVCARESIEALIARHNQLITDLAAAHKALMVCDGAMMGKVKPSSVAFKMVNAILRPENAEVWDGDPKAPPSR
jgi:hypothetical protein